MYRVHIRRKKGWKVEGGGRGQSESTRAQIPKTGAVNHSKKPTCKQVGHTAPSPSRIIEDSDEWER